MADINTVPYIGFDKGNLAILLLQVFGTLLCMVGLITGFTQFVENQLPELLSSADRTNDSSNISSQLANVVKLWLLRILESHKRNSKKGLQKGYSDYSNCDEQINENFIISKVSGLFSLFFRSSLFSFAEAHAIVNNASTHLRDVFGVTEYISEDLIRFLGYVANGGWALSIGFRTKVDVYPMSLFAKYDIMAQYQIVFPCSAIAQKMQSDSGRNLVWIYNCGGAIEQTCSIDKSQRNRARELLNFDASISQKTFIPITEFVTIRDPFSPLNLSWGLFDNYPFPDATTLSRYLHDTVSSMSEIVLKEPVSFLSAANEKQHISEKSMQPNSSSSDQHSLTMFTAQAKCLLVHLVRLETNESSDQEAEAVFQIISRDFENILNVSTTDYMSAITAALETIKLKHGELDILKSLLKEGNVGFLEKISLRLWPAARYVLNTDDDTLRSKLRNTAEKPGSTIINGDVQIVDNKFKAICHFPSVKILDVNLKKMTGRWFYECILLTDGLMQIGWIDKSFRCDPLCGQGVGDHPKSWAFDGFRTKKW